MRNGFRTTPGRHRCGRQVLRVTLLALLSVLLLPVVAAAQVVDLAPAPGAANQACRGGPSAASQPSWRALHTKIWFAQVRLHVFQSAGSGFSAQP